VEVRGPRQSSGITHFAADGGLLCFVSPGARSRITVVRDGHAVGAIESAFPLAAIHCAGEVVVCVDSESTLFVQMLVRKAPPLSAALGCQRVTAVVCAATFHVVICGSRDGILHVCRLRSARRVRQIDAGGGKPLRILVTPGWGFVVVCLGEMEKGAHIWRLGIWTINGALVAKRGIAAPIVQWNTWTSHAGFDFVAFCDSSKRLFVFEVYTADIGEPVREFVTRVIGIHFWERSQMIVVVTSEGTLEFVPWQPTNELCE
jgi:hypothetical protein